MYDQSSSDPAALSSEAFLSVLLAKLERSFPSVHLLSGESVLRPSTQSESGRQNVNCRCCLGLTSDSNVQIHLSLFCTIYLLSHSLLLIWADDFIQLSQCNSSSFITCQLAKYAHFVYCLPLFIGVKEYLLLNLTFSFKLLHKPELK